MALENLFRAAGIANSGLTAERVRLDVTANNIANAFATRTPQGGPFRRQDVVFEAVLADVSGTRPDLGGVAVTEIVDDPSEFNIVFKPSHPDADAEGYVRFPNVHLPVEMVNLVTASRSYEANVRAAQAFFQMSDQALAILRG